MPTTNVFISSDTLNTTTLTYMAQPKKWTNKTIFAAGVNYYPIPQIAIKAEYNYRNLKKGYNDEPAINIGVAYEGFFL